jgi:peptidoglycan/xylan/chitin deacetylase (PgdA/CDA1 family)
LYRQIASYLSPAGERGLLSILIYHRVLVATDALFPHEVTQATFDMQMAHLKSVFNVLPLSEAVERLKCGTLPARAACITFDDGYADNATIALPILQRHGLKATFFIATAYIDGGRMFNDSVIEAIRQAKTDRLDLRELGLGQFELNGYAAKSHAINEILSELKYSSPQERRQKIAQLYELAQCGTQPDNLMMTSEQIKALHHAGMEIGAHTDSHPILAKMDSEAVKQEILAGKQFLEKLLDEPIRLFAYPNGKPGIDYLPEQAKLVKALEFMAAVSTQRAVASQYSDHFQLPRFTPWQSNIHYFIPELLKNLRRRRTDIRHASDNQVFELKRKRLRRES